MKYTSVAVILTYLGRILNFIYILPHYVSIYNYICRKAVRNNGDND